MLFELSDDLALVGTGERRGGKDAVQLLVRLEDRAKGGERLCDGVYG